MKLRFYVISAAALVFVTGCQTQSQPAPVVKVVIQEKKTDSVPAPRKRTAEQIQLLHDFAQKESPKILQTLQSLRGEIVESGRKIKKLHDELVDFDRDPEYDEDYKSLKSGQQELQRAYDAIYDSLEEAYIAAKKFEATPSREEYRLTMKKALEDGLRNTEMTIERYRVIGGLK